MYICTYILADGEYGETYVSRECSCIAVNLREASVYSCLNNRPIQMKPKMRDRSMFDRDTSDAIESDEK